jgi:hypothetical protein
VRANDSEGDPVAVIYDRAITDARRTVGAHQAKRSRHTIICSAGCDRWPCKPFSRAFAIITRNSNTRAAR